MSPIPMSLSTFGQTYIFFYIVFEIHRMILLFLNNLFSLTFLLFYLIVFPYPFQDQTHSAHRHRLHLHQKRQRLQLISCRQHLHVFYAAMGSFILATHYQIIYHVMLCTNTETKWVKSVPLMQVGCFPYPRKDGRSSASVVE